MASNSTSAPVGNREVVLGLVGSMAGCCCPLLWGSATISYACEELTGWRLGGVSDLSSFSRKATVAGDRFKGCPVYEDYRLMLRDRSIDGIICSTHEHLRGRVILDSLNAGKHVFVVPPMCRYLPEAFEIREAAKRTGKLVQVAVSDLSDPAWSKAAEIISSGKLGQLVMGQGSYMLNSPRGAGNYSILPWATKDDLDWKAWLGSVGTRKGYDPEEYFRPFKYYKYSAGVLVSNQLPQRLYPMMLAMGMQFPTRVASIGTKPVHTDRVGNGVCERDCPESMQVIAEFPNGASMMFFLGSVNEQGIPCMIRGHKASLLFGGQKVELRPEPTFANEIKPETYESGGSAMVYTFRNWFESIRGNAQLVGGIELAIRAQTVAALAEMSDRLSTVCLFDEKTRTIRDGSGRELAPLNYGWKPGES